MLTELEQIKRATGREPSSCACNTCKSMCHIAPCIGTPEDILRLINNGYVHYLAPTQWEAGLERGIPVTYMFQVRFDKKKKHCSLLDENNMCRLHLEGIKPTEGVLSHCTPPPAGAMFFLPDAVAATWHLARNAKPISLILKAIESHENKGEEDADS